jgi:L-threonylcarbamoyladenylate synthase
VNTKIWSVLQAAAENEMNERAFEEAALLLKQGEVVAFPTETVYGLGGNIFSDEAIRKIFAAKGRPADNPLIVHVAQDKGWTSWVKDVPEYAFDLADSFWPGPLTLILPISSGALSPLVTAGLKTVGIRMPDHPVALKLIEAAGFPLAAPSANRSGRPSPTRAEHVIEDLSGKIAGILDGGSTGVGLESTVVDATGPVPVILRPGAITYEQLSEVVKVHHTEEGQAPEEEHQPKSPGMKYTHYAPRGEMWIVYGPPEKRIRHMRDWLKEADRQGQRAGILTFDEHLVHFPEGVVLSLGSLHNLSEMGRNLYDRLRSFDERGIDRIWAEAIPAEGLGVALMNRLLKAAGGRLRQV